MNEFFAGMRDLLARLTFKGTWLRVGVFVLGIALTLIGINILVGNRVVTVAQSVAGTVKDVI